MVLTVPTMLGTELVQQRQHDLLAAAEEYRRTRSDRPQRASHPAAPGRFRRSPYLLKAREGAR